MKFLKDNSYDIVKLFINQIGITIFSLLLYTAVGFIEDDSLFLKIQVAVSTFATFFYFSLIYTAAWDLGANDKIRIDGGRQSRIPAKGAIMAFIANVPNFVIAVIAVVCMAIYIISGNEAAYTGFGIFNLLIRFISAMYLGLLQGIFSFLESDTNLYFFWQSIGYALAPLLNILVVHVGYTFGEKEFRLSSILSLNSGKGKK